MGPSGNGKTPRCAHIGGTSLVRLYQPERGTTPASGNSVDCRGAGQAPGVSAPLHRYITTGGALAQPPTRKKPGKNPPQGPKMRGAPASWALILNKNAILFSIPRGEALCAGGGLAPPFPFQNWERSDPPRPAPRSARGVAAGSEAPAPHPAGGHHRRALGGPMAPPRGGGVGAPPPSLQRSGYLDGTGEGGVLSRSCPKIAPLLRWPAWQRAYLLEKIPLAFYLRWHRRWDSEGVTGALKRLGHTQRLIQQEQGTTSTRGSLLGVHR